VTLAISLAEIDVSNPRLFQSGEIDACFARLRRECPVHFCADGQYGPFWSLTRYADIVAVNARDDIFSCSYELGGHVLGYDRMFRANGVDARMFQSTDAPVHTAQRKAIAPVVARSSVRDMAAMIERECAEVLDALPVGEPFDWVSQVSVEITGRVLARLFDFPWDDRHLLTYWSDVAVTEPGFGIVASWAERAEALQACFEYFSRLWQERVASPPANDLLSLMAYAEGTRNLSAEEFLGNLINVIVGGNDTTRNSLTGAVLAFSRYPEQWQRLRAAPELIAGAAPEIIRWQTPISHMARTALADFEVGDETIRRGDRVALWYLSGNRDERAIAQPEKFIIDRERPRQHLSFGFGAHHCVGYRLAELQVQTVWTSIAQRFSRIEIAGEPVRTCSNIIHGYRALPVVVHH